MPKCSIRRKAADFSASVAYSTPGDIARWLNCSLRTARSYCERGLIPEAVQTLGGQKRSGHWRIRLPLSTKTKVALSKLKYPSLWRGKVGRVTGNFEEEWAEWLMLSQIYNLDVRNDDLNVVSTLSDGIPEDEWHEVQRRIVERLRNGESFGDLILHGWILQLHREGQNPTKRRLAARMGMSPGTFYDKFPDDKVKDALASCLRVVGRDIKTVKSKREIE